MPPINREFQKTMISRLRTAFIYSAFAAVALAGCGSDGGTEFAGNYAGVATNDDAYYAIEATVEDSGAITGKLYVYDGTTPVPPLDAAYPGEDFGEVLDFTGTVAGNEVTVTTDDESHTISGTFDESGVFTGTFDGSFDFNFAAAFPITGGEDLSVGCGEYELYTIPASLDAGSRLITTTSDGDVVIIQTESNAYGIMVDYDGNLTGTFQADREPGLCGGSETCGDFNGEFAGELGGDPITLDVYGGSYITDELLDDLGYLYTEGGADLNSDELNGGFEFSTEHCYSWDVEE